MPGTAATFSAYSSFAQKSADLRPGFEMFGITSDVRKSISMPCIYVLLRFF